MPSASFAGATAVMAPLSATTDRRNLSRRILSGAVLGPLTLILAYWGGWPFGVAVAAASVIGFGEWLRLVNAGARSAVDGLPIVILAAYWSGGAGAALFAVVVLAALTGLISRRSGMDPLLAAFGAPYVGLTLLGLVWLRDRPSSGWELVLFVLLVIWASDIGAFFVGRGLGGPRLAPRISPNKTWAGFGGALLASAATGVAWALLIAHSVWPASAVVIAVLLSLAGQAGDLFESAIKRRFGAKDSGGLIPGHGGMLDRIDALLWATPCFSCLHAFGLTSGLLP